MIQCNILTYLSSNPHIALYTHILVLSDQKLWSRFSGSGGMCVHTHTHTRTHISKCRVGLGTWKNETTTVISIFENMIWARDCSLSFTHTHINTHSHSHSKKAVAPHSSALAWKIPWMEEPGGLQPMGSLRVGHDWATSLSLFTSTHWRRKWQPTPVFLPENPRDGGAWWAAVCGVAQSRTQPKRLSSSSSTFSFNTIWVRNC